MNTKDIKQSNRNRIYFYIREKGQATTKEIAYELKLSLPTVTQNLDYLAGHGLIASEKKIETKSGGRNPIAHTYVADIKVAIGLDVAKRHIICTMIDLKGNVLHEIHKKTPYERSDAYFQLLGQTVEELIDSAGQDRDKIIGVGIGMPGLVSHEEDRVVDGRVIDNTGMTLADVAKYIPYKAKLLHDSYAAGYAESWIASDDSNLFYFSLCDTVGGLVIVSDNIYLGEGLYSGEIGHLKIEPNGRKCYCGQSGCLEAYCNARILSEQRDGDLNLFFEDLKAGDKNLTEVFNKYLGDLAKGIIAARMMYGCKIILGGFVGVYMEDHMDTLYDMVDPQSPFGEKGKDYIKPGKLKKSSVATGTALHFVDEFLNTL